ncbi:hypothetical protein BS47DRAFT_1390903 [Hydnum rufescens UP504]|uniref:Uncharacterized protein n=1 Tax=Hydnum rufescens UP504 TaxID=1448309 RepID=A0A9P6DZ21_9AGAM|nr:hypothetical protein BS47DRAFT_1390903 [Hydnum rufescens UP504]
MSYHLCEHEWVQNLQGIGFMMNQLQLITVLAGFPKSYPTRGSNLQFLLQEHAQWLIRFGQEGQLQSEVGSILGQSQSRTVIKDGQSKSLNPRFTQIARSLQSKVTSIQGATQSEACLNPKVAQYKVGSIQGQVQSQGPVNPKVSSIESLQSEVHSIQQAFQSGISWGLIFP